MLQVELGQNPPYAEIAPDSLTTTSAQREENPIKKWPLITMDP